MYGGTKTEMERLLADAEKLSGVKYDLSNLSDVYNAIHVIQEEMGITGTTAKEASETYSGSLAAMVATGKNVLANLTLGEDIKPSLQALGETTVTFIKGNLLPMAKNIVSGIGSLLIENGEEMIASGANMLVSFIEGISSKIPDLIPEGLQMIATLCDVLLDNLPAILGAGIELLKSLVQGIINGLPTLIAEGPRIINDFADAIYMAMGELLLAGAEIIVSLVKGIWENVPVLIENAGEIFMMFINMFSLSNIFNLGKNLIQNMINGIKNLGPNMIKTGGNIVEFMANGIKNLATHPITTLKNIAGNAMKTIKGLDWKSIGSNIIQGIINGLKNGISSIIKTAKEVAGAALTAAKKALGIKSPSRIFEDEVGKMIDLGLAAGIENNINAVSDSMKELSQASVGMIETDFVVSAGKVPDTKVQDKDSKNKMIVIHTHVDLDGREVARGTAEYISDQLPWEEL